MCLSPLHVPTEAGTEDTKRQRICRTENRCMTPNKVLREPEMQPFHEHYQLTVTMGVNSIPSAQMQARDWLHAHPPWRGTISPVLLNGLGRNQQLFLDRAPETRLGGL
jgi:hypothetical protein